MSVSFAEGDYIKMFMRGRPITMFIPADVENYEDVRTELPPERLKLEWVYPFVWSQTLSLCMSLTSVLLLSVCGSKQNGGCLLGLHFHLSSCFHIADEQKETSRMSQLYY